MSYNEIEQNIYTTLFTNYDDVTERKINYNECSRKKIIFWNCAHHPLLPITLIYKLLQHIIIKSHLKYEYHGPFVLLSVKGRYVESTLYV